MYAVINTGGKQYRVTTGEVLRIEKLTGDLGDKVQFNEVLLVSDANGEAPKVAFGTPLLNGAVVEAQILGQGRGDKITIVKMKRRKQYRRVQGHRQELTEVLVTKIQSGTGLDAELSASEASKISDSFHSRLKERGLAITPKTLGSRKRMANALAQADKSQDSQGASASKKTAGRSAKPKKAKTTTRKTSAKKTTKKA